ncbi:MAG: glycosyltransferase [Bilifractor sp.]|jgi:1,2-diacylglycerol-3-alpha-glucose alpha-1,2-glucosyltransferase
MKVCVYQGALGIVEKSGVGQAIHHQIRELRLSGVQMTEAGDPETEIIQINTVFPDSVITALRARRQNKRILWYGHSTEEDFRNSFRLSNIVSPLFRKWIVRCYSMADAIITPTDYSRSIIQGYGVKTPIFVLSNGVDTDFFKPDPARRASFRARYHIGPRQKAVLSVGHYMERKGIIDFIELAAKMPDVLFFWFGHTNRILMTDDVMKAINSATPNVLFPGYASREELCDAYCGCDLFCFMSHEETEGIVVLEALASRIPVLVRDIPAYQGWLHDGFNVYKANTQEQFLSRAEYILSGELPDLTAAGRECAESRSLQKVGEKLMAIQKKMIGADNDKLL